MVPAVARVLSIITPVRTIIGGAAAESLYAWYDPDFYTSVWWEADLEERVASLNNDWQNLYREARSAGFTEADPALRQLLADMDRWWQWKEAFNAAILRRFIAGSRDWDAELKVWVEKFHEDFAALTEADVRIKRAFREAGIDPRLHIPPASEPLVPEYVWWMGGTGLFALGLIYVMRATR